MSEHTEELLNTRNMGGVVKVGDTVRRPAGPWTPAVHALLAFLHESGFDFAPRPLGIDEAGRAILTYIEGDTEMTQVADRVWFDALPEAARRLRQLHDLTVDFVPPGRGCLAGTVRFLVEARRVFSHLRRRGEGDLPR